LLAAPTAAEMSLVLHVNFIIHRHEPGFAPVI
jgi:hypothetical protein